MGLFMVVVSPSVVAAALRDQECIPFDPVDEPMLAINSPRPIAFQVSPQRFGLADALVWNFRSPADFLPVQS